MKTLLLKREIPLDVSYDVIVAGGGPAGCASAAAAAREGAKTLLIEATGALGGMGTSGLVPAWCPFTDKEKIIYGGIAERVLKECIAGMPHVPENQFNWTPIDAELLKQIYDNLMIENNVNVMFNAFVASVESGNSGNIEAVSVASKEGLKAYKSSVYIDCTGDADLVAWAGGEWDKGDETGDLQPVTHCFTLTNVDMYAYRHGRKLKYGDKNPVMHDIVASGRYPDIPYRCLTPRGLKNVLVAGRSISTDRIVQGSTRVMPVCLAMGEAAGIAAAMSAKESCDVHSVNTNELRGRLKARGAYLPDTEELGE